MFCPSTSLHQAQHLLADHVSGCWISSGITQYCFIKERKNICTLNEFSCHHLSGLRSEVLVRQHNYHYIYIQVILIWETVQILLFKKDRSNLFEAPGAPLHAAGSPAAPQWLWEDTPHSGCPGRLWSLLLWRYSRPARTRSCAACCR